jgi:hypothetical protein
MIGKFIANLATAAAKRHLVVKTLIATVAVASAISAPVQSKALAADHSYAYGGNFAVSGSFFITYDYELLNGVFERRMRVFESGKLGLINAPIESAVWSPTTDEVTFYGKFTARGITYTLKANYILVRGIRAAQFFVYDSNSKLVGQSSIMRATVFDFFKLL